MRIKEEWKIYPINEDFEGFYRIEVSNLGNVKTYSNMYPEGKDVQGSLQGGYPILKAKLRKKWKDTDREKIDVINDEITALNTEIKSKISDKASDVELTEIRKIRDRLIQKRKKLNNKLTNKNTINFALLFHKAVAELFLPIPTDKEKKFIIHKDFVKTNNAAENLDWATKEELDERLTKHPKMVLREFKKQFVDFGPQVTSSKLTEMEVLLIKKRLKRGDSLKKLATKFNVSDMQIHRIKTGENWSHVKLIEDIKSEEDK